MIGEIVPNTTVALIPRRTKMDKKEVIRKFMVHTKDHKGRWMYWTAVAAPSERAADAIIRAGNPKEQFVVTAA